ncbi:N-acetyldiaminopimelate deacetylase [Deinococcus xinjiangensis]|uniref:N-acetyldiaminopimelate deacetylase n=1 Tax=Deinococcus xinjiangensis TaxID=457454 RepID=A0ABP9VA75_9DEIO
MTQLKDDPHAALMEEVVAWRRHLHENPELSFQEHETAKFVQEQLEKLPNLTLSRPTETSVLAVLKGTAGAGKTVLLRADMDALPIDEEADVPFKSKKAGVMHACGHDGHTAMLLGAAKMLSAHPEELHGEVRFIFQHAEEFFPGGAQQVVDAGIMEGVDMVVGEHLMSPVPTGVIVLREGPLLAASDAFDVTIQGKGGHGANPHETVDPVVIAAQIIMALQTVVSRSKDPIDTAVVTVAQIHGGSANNVIPDTVTLGGTVRSFDENVRQMLRARIEQIIKGVCDTYGATYTLDYRFGYRATLNDAGITQLLREMTKEVLPDAVLHEGKPNMGSEDFSAYLTKAPGTFIVVGAGGPDAAPHHHPKFTIDERALEHGVKLYVGAARKLTQG